MCFYCSEVALFNMTEQFVTDLQCAAAAAVIIIVVLNVSAAAVPG